MLFFFESRIDHVKDILLLQNESVLMDDKFESRANAYIVSYKGCQVEKKSTLD